VAGASEVAGLGVGIDQELDGPGAIGRADPGGDAEARVAVHAHGEGGLERLLVVVGHEGQPEGVGARLGDRGADQPARVGGHEIDDVGRGVDRGAHQVALVLAILIIGDDDHFAVADVADGVFHSVEHRIGCRHRVTPSPLLLR
jgi:hypothetical protein